MFGPLGFQELLLILGIALLIFGPRKLPEIGRTIGRGMGEFRRATNELKRTIEHEVDVEDRHQHNQTALPAKGSSASSQTATSEPSTTSPVTDDSSPETT